MIKQLNGVVQMIKGNFVVLDVNGVGYQIFTNHAADFSTGSEARFFTHLAVRENALDLYGFSDVDTLDLFELLLDLPKIGPKSALQILTQADAEVIRTAVYDQDAGYLSKVSSISKKSAEKIVSGLKDKLGDRPADPIGRWPTRSAAYTTDTIDALISLGYPVSDARRVVFEIVAEYGEAVSTSDIIRLSLQRL